MPQPNPPLNSAQYASLQREYEAKLCQILSELNLRKWLVERILDKVTVSNVTDFLVIAEHLHTFIIGRAFEPLQPLPNETPEPNVCGAGNRLWHETPEMSPPHAR